MCGPLTGNTCINLTQNTCSVPFQSFLACLPTISTMLFKTFSSALPTGISSLNCTCNLQAPCASLRHVQRNMEPFSESSGKPLKTSTLSRHQAKYAHGSSVLQGLIPRELAQTRSSLLRMSPLVPSRDPLTWTRLKSTWCHTLSIQLFDMDLLIATQVVGYVVVSSLNSSGVRSSH
jgi:hypothetical protein